MESFLPTLSAYSPIRDSSFEKRVSSFEKRVSSFEKRDSSVEKRVHNCGYEWRSGSMASPG